MNIIDRLGYLTLVHMTCSLGSFETRLQEFFFFFLLHLPLPGLNLISLLLVRIKIKSGKPVYLEDKSRQVIRLHSPNISQ